MLHWGLDMLQFYFQGRRNNLLSAVDQLLVLKSCLQKSEWFYRHEIGMSSLKQVEVENNWHLNNLFVIMQLKIREHIV